jgi:hypothetical protein
MNKIKYLKPLWWVLHVVAIALVLWIGHSVQF